MAERSKAVDSRPTIIMMRGFDSLFAQTFLFYFQEKLTLYLLILQILQLRMAERFKAVGIKTTIIKIIMMRGFESLSAQIFLFIFQRKLVYILINQKKQCKARMAERSKAVDLRPTIVMMRGFESLFAQTFYFFIYQL